MYDRLTKWRTLRFFPFIPEGKIQSEIIFKLLVMHRVMSSAYQQFHDPVPSELLWIYLDVEMVDNAADGHQHELKNYNSNEHRYKEKR